MPTGRGTNLLRAAWVMCLAPLLFYLVCFLLLTWPLPLSLATHYIADTGDFCQDAEHNLWNMWWVNKAVTELHQPIWYTDFLHYPHGTTLLGHTLNPFNGFAGILLQKFMTLPQAYNCMVIFGFVVGGWTGFLLAYLFSRSYWGSILGGYIFTFSSYHFAHALGHLQLVSLEWIPVFIGAFYLLLQKPTALRAIAAALALFLVVLCDYYYAFYCIITAAILVVHGMWMKRDILFMFRKGYVKPIVVFLCYSLVSTGALFIFFLASHVRDPFTAGRPASLDLLSLFIYGGQWRFRWLTEPFWLHLPPNPTENNAHLGLTVIIALVYGWVRRAKCTRGHLGLWYAIFIVFTVLALGPYLRVGGRELSCVVLPFRMLGWLFPPMKLVGCPVRMVVMSFLAAGVIVAMVIRNFFDEVLKWRGLRILFIAAFVIEYLPYPLTSIPARVPQYVHVIRNLPPGATVDTLNHRFAAPYYQTLYERPRCVGLVSRYPASVERRFTEFDEVLMEDIPRHAGRLYHDYKLRYLLTKPDYPPNNHLRLLYEDRECRIYALVP